MELSIKALVLCVVVALYLIFIEVYSHVIARRFPALRISQD